MYFTYLDLPSIPNDLEVQILAIVEKSIANQQFNDSRSKLNIDASEKTIKAITNVKYSEVDSLGFPLSQAWNYFKNQAHFDFLEVNEALSKWTHTVFGSNHTNIQAMYGGTSISPHIDEERKYAYNYVIDCGGGASTCFWKPKKEFKHLTVYPQTVFPYTRLDLVEEIKIEKRRWHRLDSRQIHSVENLNTKLTRISVSLSFV